MKPKFTPSTGSTDAGKTSFILKVKFLPAALFWALCCFYAITGYTQTQNEKSVKPASSHKSNNLHPVPWPWFTTGNSGTDTSKNFIGTKDAQPLLFKVNNQRAGYLEYNDFSQTTAFGYQTLISNVPSDSDGTTGGIGNSAFGYKSLYSNRSGELNTAIGQLNLTSNTTGNINTGIGAYSLISNTEGAFNTAIGSFALASNTTGWFNSATGDFALYSNTTGSDNIANGCTFTLASNTEGSDNIGTGVLALTSNTTGNANVAYGSYSLASNIKGNKNTALGDHADVSAGNLHNATAIGNRALVDANNKVRIGNNNVTSIGGAVGWTNYSDERIKDNVKENVPGLEFIKALRPVTYHFSVAKEKKLMGIKDISAKDITLPQLNKTKMPGIKSIEMQKDILNKQLKNIPDEEDEIEKIQFTGFLAQDVDKAAKSIGYDFSGIDKSGKIMGLRYSDFVVPLVKAVQELSKQNEDLQKQIDELKATIASGDNSSTKTVATLNEASIEQNIPNPFSKTTTIRYNLPQKFTNAQIIITDKNGRTLKQINISGQSKGTVNVDASMLTGGVYSYSLVVD